MKRPVLLVACTAATLLLGACSGGSTSTDTKSSTAAGSAAASASAPAAAGDLKSYDAAQLPMSWGEYKARKAPTAKQPPAGSTAQYIKAGDAVGAEYVAATLIPTTTSFDATVQSMNWPGTKKVNDHLVCTTSGPAFCLANLTGGVLMTMDGNLVKNADAFATMTEKLYQSLG